MTREKKGLLIEYEYCTGCFTCQVACAQEYGWPAGMGGIQVIKKVQQRPSGKPSLAFIPIPTELCTLCGHRTRKGLDPACVQHCMAKCMTHGPITQLIKQITRKTRHVLWTIQ